MSQLYDFRTLPGAGDRGEVDGSKTAVQVKM